MNRSQFLAFASTAIGITAVCVGGTSIPEVPRSSRVVIKDQGFLPFAGAPIDYRSADLSDPIARLEERLERGEAPLEFEPQHGYLRSVLNALRVSICSQTLVFSKTSFQFPQITPATPRALYFNDDVYVGQVHDGKFLEFISFDPRQGAIFYVIDERPSPRPRFERAAVDCVQCHVATSTRGVPGVFLRSVFTKPSGYQAGGTKAFVTGQESPLGERWGGWYVTSIRGAEGAMGNAIASDSRHPDQLDKPAAANLSSLAPLLNTAAYLSGSSDIVALMVLAHQTQMHNFITQTNYKTRLALYAEEQRSIAAGVPAGTLSEVERKDFEDSAEKLVRYLLFADETPLNGPIVGNTSFAEDFAARGPFDSRGRSLREFDLRTRIFKYPCSYLIYSESFDAIPSPARDYVYRRLFEVLSGRDQSPQFARLSAPDRRAILEILVETKPGLPREWKQFVGETNHVSTSHVSTDSGSTNSGSSKRASAGAQALNPGQ
jgi:hypothetical protein